MPILIKNRNQYTDDILDKAILELENLQEQIVYQLKEALTKFVSIEPLYEIRDYIDELIIEWENEEVDLEEDDLDE